MKKSFVFVIFIILTLNNIYAQNFITVTKANIAYDEGDCEKAIPLFSELIDDESKFEKYLYYYLRADCYYRLENYENAENDIKKALKVKKNNPSYDLIKGNGNWLYYLVERKDGITKKALRHLRKAPKYVPSSILYATIAYAECDLGLYKASLKSLDQAYLLNPNNSWIFNNRALVYLNLNKLDLARSEVNRSIQIDNQNPYAFKNSALIYIAEGMIDSACNDLKIAKELKITEIMTGNDLEEIDSLILKYCEP